MCGLCYTSYISCRYIFPRTQLHGAFCILSQGPLCFTERTKGGSSSFLPYRFPPVHPSHVIGSPRHQSPLLPRTHGFDTVDVSSRSHIFPVFRAVYIQTFMGISLFHLVWQGRSYHEQENCNREANTDRK